MYAIVRTGGKQYRVERGQRLLIERLAADEGAEVSLQPLLYRSDEAVLDRAGLEQVKVTAKVIEHVRGEKLRVFKFKPKRGYRRRTGHRQQLTRIEVTEIASHKRKATRARAQDTADAAAEAAAAPGGEAPAKGAPRAQTGTGARAKPAPARRPKAPPGSEAAAKPARARKAGTGKAPAKPARAQKAGTGKAPAKPARAPKRDGGASDAGRGAAKPARARKPRKDSDGT